MRALLLVSVSFLPLVCICAQTENQQKISVSGNVVNSVDGQPIRGALVELSASDRKTVMTGADGHFAFDGVAPGYVNLSARRPGFYQRYQRATPPLKLGENTAGVTLKLWPLAKISGRVLDREGEPIEDVGIQCFGEQMNNGHKVWQPRAGASTDEGGNFVLEDLAPGAYILGTSAKPLYIVHAKSEAARFIYPPTFYPDSPTRDAAQRIEVTPGADMKVDMTLRSMRGSHISMTTVPAMTNVMATITQEDEEWGGRGAQVQRERGGVLTFPAVAPGSWKIVVRAFPGGRGARDVHANAEQLYGELAVEVGAADIDDLKVALGKLPDIPVTVSGAQNQIPVQLFSKNGMPINGAMPAENGDVKIPNVAPGRYHVVVPPTGGNTCVSSITSGSQDLQREDLVVSAGAEVAPIQVVESSNCAQLSINVTPNEAVSIIMASGQDSRILMSGALSAYVARGLSEGDYKLYAFDDITDLEYANPEAMRDFKSQSVHLTAGQNATVQVEVNERLRK